MRKPASVFAVLFLLAAAVVFGQGSTTIKGRVTASSDGAPLPGVTVSIDELHISTVTDADGRYTLTAPATGRDVKISAVLEGFQRRTLDLRLSGDATRDFALRVAFGQEITVGSRAVGAEQEKAVPVDVIAEEQIESAAPVETNQI